MGQCPAKILKALSCIVSLRAGDQSVHKAASVPFVVHDARDRNYYYWESNIATCDQISRAFPLPPDKHIIIY